MRALILLAAMALASCGSRQDEGSSAGSEKPSAASGIKAVETPPIEPTAKMGEMVFRRCVACHTIEAGGRDGIGPNLHNIVNRSIGSVDGFRYSNAMKAEVGVWDKAALDRFLENPMKAIPGSRMAFAGIYDPADRESLYLYLLENSE